MSKYLYYTITRIPTKSTKDSLIDYIEVIEKIDGSYTLNKDINTAYFRVNIKTYHIDNSNLIVCYPEEGSFECFTVKKDDIYKDKYTNSNFISALNLIEYYSSNNLETHFYSKLKSYFNLNQETEEKKVQTHINNNVETNIDPRYNHMTIGLWGDINNRS